jgi:hypothetical protein
MAGRGCDGTPFAFSGLSVSDNITVGSQNALHISGSQTSHSPTTGDGSFPDTYFACSNVCPDSTGETDALQNWTVAGVGLLHVNALRYKCASISIDGR